MSIKEFILGIIPNPIDKISNYFNQNKNKKYF